MTRRWVVQWETAISDASGRIHTRTEADMRHTLSDALELAAEAAPRSAQGRAQVWCERLEWARMGDVHIVRDGGTR